MITKEIEIEILLEKLPEAVGYLMDNNIRCLRCGEPIWGTLEEAAKEKGFSEIDIQRFVTELNEMYDNKSK